MNIEEFKKEFFSAYLKDSFFDPWTLTVINKTEDMVKFKVEDYTPVLIQPCQEYPEVSSVSSDLLTPYIEELANLVISVDQNVEKIILNDNLAWETRLF